MRTDPKDRPEATRPFFATPAYGGKVELEYHLACLALKDQLNLNGIEHAFYGIANESLITRGRNVCAARFLEEDYDPLVFIDADIVFTPEDMAKLLKLADRAEVAVGVYAMKKVGAGYAAWVPTGNLTNAMARSAGGACELVTDLEPYREPLEVAFAGTGFMAIRRSVFGRLKSAYPKLARQEGLLGNHAGAPCWNFFGTMAYDVPNELPIELSEDYSFCQRFRSLGGKIMMDTSIRLKHIGRYFYGYG